MGILTPPGFKIYRNVYVQGYKTFPYQKLSGRKTLMYRGKVMCIDSIPDEYDSKQDILFDCDCDFSEWKNLKRVFK